MTEERPVPEAFKGEYTYVDVRYTNDPRKAPAYHGESDWWYEKGTNHRLVDGRIARDLRTEGAWFVDFKNLEEFHGFIKRVGYVSIRNDLSNGRDLVLDLERSVD